MPTDDRQLGPFDGPPPLPDASAREYAVDPRHNVVLEASAGTGKTSVLVGRYLNLLRAGVDPANVLAITFTRKAAAEMRERIVGELKREADRSPEGRRLWLQLRDRLADIAISTIDAFCLSLLREFPLEADLDPSFQVADETEAARLVDEALEQTLAISRNIAQEDEEVALVFAELTAGKLRQGLRHLLDRRLVAAPALARYVRIGARGADSAQAAERFGLRIVDALDGVPGGLAGFLADGPTADPRFRLLAAELRALAAGATIAPGELRALADDVREYFISKSGEPRKRPHGFAHGVFPSEQSRRRHGNALATAAPAVSGALFDLSRDLNAVLARGVWRILLVALDRYQRLLSEHDVVDFSGALERAVELLRQMDEFARSRFRLESRYHHVLVDEFQDTSRLQWELVSLLVRSWGEGLGLGHEAPLAPSIFIVGDRKQSIYRFRDAEVAVLEEAGRFISALRPGDTPRRSISHSFRAAPELLAFVNDVFVEVNRGASGRSDAFVFGEDDSFPVERQALQEGRSAQAGDPRLGLVVSSDARRGAAAVAEEIARLLREGQVRDPRTGLSREIHPGDVAILFRTRETHKEYEEALEARGIPAYVYKGLGFFDAPEIQDLSALLRFLAAPRSEARAAALLRSRLVRVSDRALFVLRRHLAGALLAPELPAGWETLGDEDRRVLGLARASVSRWLALVDRVPPAEVLDTVLAEAAYEVELRGPRRTQGRENVKKLRALVRRLQNRGYATLGRIAAHLDRLSTGDESNAVIDAIDAVNLMTVHAAKGLEFPVVFVVNVGRGTGMAVPPVRLIADGIDAEPVVSVGAFRSDADEEEISRNREETKRLLYVALTRARDRLYIGVVTRSGFKPARGSLGEALPSAVASIIEQAARAGPGVTGIAWEAHSGGLHDFRLCPQATPGGTPARSDVVPSTGTAEIPDEDDASARRWPLSSRHGSVTALLSGQVGRAAVNDTDHRSDLLTGRLVHRLFNAGLPSSASGAELVEAARHAVSDEERDGCDDVNHAVHEAVRAYLAISARDDLRALLKDGEVRHEVPFSIKGDLVAGILGPASSVLEVPRIVRGAIDCLVRTRAGEWVVLEIKTGGPAAWHERQLAVYIEAARRLFPGAPIQGWLLYA